MYSENIINIENIIEYKELLKNNIVIKEETIANLESEYSDIKKQIEGIKEAIANIKLRQHEIKKIKSNLHQSFTKAAFYAPHGIIKSKSRKESIKKDSTIKLVKLNKLLTFFDNDNTKKALKELPRF
jgi:hypothetical protein